MRKRILAMAAAGTLAAAVLVGCSGGEAGVPAETAAGAETSPVGAETLTVKQRPGDPPGFSGAPYRFGRSSGGVFYL